MRVLVTGATGYIGSRVIPVLLARGHDVVAAVRDPQRISRYVWADRVETVLFDLDDADTVCRATAGVDAVVYLVHSMHGRDFVTKDRNAARAMVCAAERHRVQRIVYLSGLIPEGDDLLSDHLGSRLEVEEILLASGVDVTVLRAAIILGAGSTSFELVRRITERLPVTPIPAWMHHHVQPIAVADVLAIVAATLDETSYAGSFDIGGPEVLTYPQLLNAYADVAELRRFHLPVPAVPKNVVGRAVAAITAMPKSPVTALVESLTHEMVVHRGNAAPVFTKADKPMTGVREALRRSITTPLGGMKADALPDPAGPADTDPGWTGGVVDIYGGRVRHRPVGVGARLMLGMTLR